MPKTATVEEQLDVLLGCGLKLHADVERDALVDDVISEWGRERLESSPYELLLVALGGGESPRARNLWHFDTECIEDHGAYVAIANKFMELADGDLPLTDVDDHVDVEEGVARLSFTLDGKRYEWTCEVDSDWVDPTVMSRFAELMVSRNTGRRFTYLDLGGQDCLIGYASEVERRALATASGQNVVWLE